jgi:PAS domain S-box-containing protein
MDRCETTLLKHNDPCTIVGARYQRIRLHLDSQLTALIQSAMDAVICIDSTQRIILFNAAAEVMFGYESQQMVGLSLDSLLPKRYRAHHGEHIASFGKTGETSRRMGKQQVLFGLRANGEEFPIEASISRAIVHGESVFSAILRDVTERLRAEQSLRMLKDELQQLSHASIQALENEKTRIAREIHDELGQKLTAMKMDLYQLTAGQNAWAPKQFEAMQRLQKLIDETVANSRRIAANLRPLMLDDLGLSAALEWQIEQFSRRFQVQCDWQVDPRADELPKETASHVFRIVQEGLNNIVKHANAQNATVSVQLSDSAVRITISDDGIGMPSAETAFQSQPPGIASTQAREKPTNTRYGLLGIRERAYSQSGQMSIGNSETGGVVLTVNLPLQQAITRTENVAENEGKGEQRKVDRP